MVENSNPGNLVDVFPILDRLPDFLSPWRRSIVRQRAHNQTVYKALLQDVIDKVETGQLRAEQTFASRLWYDRKKLGMDELDVAYLSGTM